MELPVFRSFKRGSSEIDWCEPNYVDSDVIAEYFNTISNVFFFILAPLLAYLNWEYAIRVTKASNVVWATLLLVGIGSVYFHATLSFMGQLLDELAINWVTIACFTLWYPEKQLPVLLRNKRRLLNSVIIITGILISILAFWKPHFNAIFLCISTIPIIYIILIEVKRYRKCPHVRSLGVRLFVFWIIGMVCWISDKFQCHHWQAIDFPYLHGIWHMFIAPAGSLTITICIFYDSMVKIPEQRPMIKFWPKEHWQYIGVPYVGFKEGPFV